MKSHGAFGRLILISIVVLASGTQHGCSDTPTAPANSTRVHAAASINAPGDPGAPEIVFLPPLGPRKHPRGELDTTLTPAVTICRLDADKCGADTLALFSSDSSADSTHRIVLGDRAYRLRWKIRDLPADPALAYRIVVTLGDTTVGFTDLKIVAPDYPVPPDDTARFAFITERNALNLRFQIFLPPVTLTVIAEPGVSGNLSSQSYSFRRGERVRYDFTADSGYRNLLVTLDQNLIGDRGRITMDDAHVLIASADRIPGVNPGDEWILHETRALLKATDKVLAAQQLLARLGAMEDTVNIMDRLHRVEMTVLQRDADAAAMPALDAALAGHSFDAGDGNGVVDIPPPGGGGGGVATSLLVPLSSSVGIRLTASPTLMSPTLMSSPALMSASPFAGEPVTIAYVNGILTTPLGALFAAHHVAIAAREARWGANAPFDVKLMYNRSAMASETSAEDRCVLALGIKGDWLGLNSLPGEVAKCLNSTEPRALAVLADYAEVGQQFLNVLNRSITTRPIDVDSVAAFTQRIRDGGRHVVFVMHSQGNLIVQQALTLLARRGQYAQSRDTTCIGAVALASPTSEAWPISSRHLNGLTVDGDAILFLGHNNFPRVHTPMSDSAARATTGSIRARIMGLASAASIRWGVRLHSAIESYLTPEPIRGRIKDAIVSSYRGCAVGEVRVTPQTLALRTGETGSFQAALVDMTGAPLDGRRGLDWRAEIQSDWQRAVQLTAAGGATAHYVGGTSVSAATRNVMGSAGVSVAPASLHVSAIETLSAQWVMLWSTTGDTVPIPPFLIPSVGWNGGSCSEKATFKSNGRTGQFSKQCAADYSVTSDPFPHADKYVATFFEKGSTSPLLSSSGATGSLRGSTAGPSATLDLLPGPIPMDLIGVTAFDAAGHLLASGRACMRGCVGWPPDQ
jgi:hypothetical protein